MRIEPQTILSKIKFKTYKDYPFFAELSFGKEHFLINKIKTMAVALNENNKIVILINPEFLLKNNIEENLFCYLHELMHIALNHVFSIKKHSDKDEFLMNIAQDIIVNEYIREIISPSERMEEMLIFKEKFEELKNKDVKKMTHIEIYQILYKKFNKIVSKINLPLPFSSSEKNRQGQGDGQGDVEEKENIIEKIGKDFEEKMEKFSKEIGKLKEEKEIGKEEAEILKQAYKDFYFKKLFERLSEKEKEKLKERIKEEVLRGYIIAKQRGTIFSGIEEIINHVFKKTRNWKKILREEIVSEIKGDWTWSKVSDILQTLHIAGFRQIGNLPTQDNTYSVPKIIIGIDVSASISDEDYKDFLNEIYSIFKSVNINDFEIVMWESEITKVITRKNSIKEVLEELKKRKGYGGTNLRSFLKYCSKRVNTNNSIAIILTDGYIEEDLKKEEFKMFKKVIFVLTKNCDYENISKLKCHRIKVIKIG